MLLGKKSKEDHNEMVGKTFVNTGILAPLHSAQVSISVVCFWWYRAKSDREW